MGNKLAGARKVLDCSSNAAAGTWEPGGHEEDGLARGEWYESSWEREYRPNVAPGADAYMQIAEVIAYTVLVETTVPVVEPVGVTDLARKEQELADDVDWAR